MRLGSKAPALVDLRAGRRKAGRRVLDEATHTGSRDIVEQMAEIITGHGFQVAVMKVVVLPPTAGRRGRRGRSRRAFMR